jgi:hypothetical protein
MVARKSNIKKDKEKPEIVDTSRKPSKNLKVKALPDAIEDGKMTVPVGGELIVSRQRSGRQHHSICVIKSIEGDKIETWDATLEQWFVFNIPGLAQYGIEVKAYKEN